jgi:hypothetical protein
VWRIFLNMNVREIAIGFATSAALVLGIAAYLGRASGDPDTVPDAQNLPPVVDGSSPQIQNSAGPNTSKEPSPSHNTAKPASAFGHKVERDSVSSAAPDNPLGKQSPWTIESATGLNDYGRIIDEAIKITLGPASDVFLDRSFRGIALGDKYTATTGQSPKTQPWLLSVDAKQPSDAIHEAVDFVLVDATSSRIVGVCSSYPTPLTALKESLIAKFGRSLKEVDFRRDDLPRTNMFYVEYANIQYLFPHTVVCVRGSNKGTTIWVLDRNYVEASLRPFANAVLAACHWAKRVTGYGHGPETGPVPNIPLANLKRLQNSNGRVVVLFDKASQEMAQQRKKKGLEKSVEWDVATAWNLPSVPQGAAIHISMCPSIGIPELLQSGKEDITRTLVTAGFSNLFHDVGSALIQHEFPPSAEKITVKRPERLVYDFRYAFDGSRLSGEEDNDIFARATLVDSNAHLNFVRTYEWTDEEGWSIGFGEGLSLTIKRGAPKVQPKGL